MGAWGTKLYQDDITCDVKDEYIKWLKTGLSNDEITKSLIRLYGDCINDSDDGPLFWFALADTQWNYGRLLPKIKQKALEYIENKTDLNRWQDDIKLYKIREQELNKLKEKLNSPMPPEKKVSVMRVNKAHWDIGDILLYKIRDKYIKNSEFCNKYVLFRVRGISKNKNSSLPDQFLDSQNIVSIYNWVGSEIPDLSIIDNLKFLQKENYKGELEDRIFIFDYKKRKLDKLNFEVLLKDDDYKEISVDANKQTWYDSENIDESLIYIMNFSKEKNQLFID